MTRLLNRKKRSVDNSKTGANNLVPTLTYGIKINKPSANGRQRILDRICALDIYWCRFSNRSRVRNKDCDERQHIFCTRI